MKTEYKIAGSRNYPFGAISPSDPTGHGLGFLTREMAQEHADIMNMSLDYYPNGWNTDFWKERPAPWVVFEIND
jgi:hypothetical protein